LPESYLSKALLNQGRRDYSPLAALPETFSQRNMITGGSNYITIHGDMENPVIGTYHLFPGEVEANLNAMFEHGQRKIALVCWYAPLNFPAARDHRWHHVIDSFGGVMFEQHQQNVIDLLDLIERTGFNEIHFRFAAQGRAAVSQWPAWKGGQFTENWAFIDSVRNLVNDHTSLKIIFDLALEHANEQIDTSAVHQLYCRRLWKLYSDAHGPDDSCAFSVIHGGSGLEPMLRRFRQGSLPMPACYCFDAYGFEYPALTSAASVLQAAGELSKPVYIQETNYNDARSCADIRRAVGETGLNFKGIFQWPKVRDRDPGDFPDVFPRRFDNYLVEA
jgi:hypothetical protein